MKIHRYIFIHTYAIILLLFAFSNSVDAENASSMVNSFSLQTDSVVVDSFSSSENADPFEKKQPNSSGYEVKQKISDVEFSTVGVLNPETSVELEQSYKTIFALKSNLLTTAVSWLNIGLEIPFYRNRFSFAYDHQFPWWRGGQNKNRFCMRFLQTGGEFRWWFHPRKKPSTRKEIVRDRLSGHYLGVYGMGGKYDFEHGRKFCYQGEFWSTGLTYGYSLPISKHFNLEFFLSVGYASIPYRHFIPSDDFSELFKDPDKSGKWNYFGPTKVGISLVYPIHIKRTVKSKKGGMR